MARSGTSLVEQILDSHPAVAGRGEIALLGTHRRPLDAAAHAEGESYPESRRIDLAPRGNRLLGRVPGRS